MTTLEKIEMTGVEIIEKLKFGHTLSKDDAKYLKIYNSLYSKKAVNSGKRNGSKNIQKI